MRAATISAVALAACGAGIGASPLVAPPRQRVVTRAASSRVDVDSFVFIQNEHVRLGIDISRGGAIGWFGPRGNASLSLLNIHGAAFMRPGPLLSAVITRFKQLVQILAERSRVLSTAALIRTTQTASAASPGGGDGK